MSNIKQKKKFKRLRRGFAKVEYLTIRQEAKLLFEQGHTIQFVYETLSEQELISMCYSSFYYYTNKENEKKTSISEQQEQQQPKPKEALIAETKEKEVMGVSKSTIIQNKNIGKNEIF